MDLRRLFVGVGIVAALAAPALAATGCGGDDGDSADGATLERNDREAVRAASLALQRKLFAADIEGYCAGLTPRAAAETVRLMRPIARGNSCEAVMGQLVPRPFDLAARVAARREIVSVKVAGDTATVVNRSNNGSSARVTMVRRDDGWKLDKSVELTPRAPGAGKPPTGAGLAPGSDGG